MCPVSAATDVFAPYPSLLVFTALEGAMDASVQLQMQTLLNPVTQIKCFVCFSLFWEFSIC